MTKAEYPPLPEPVEVALSLAGFYDPTWIGDKAELVRLVEFTRDAERQRIEREVMPFLLGIEHVRTKAILRAIRGEKEPT